MILPLGPGELLINETDTQDTAPTVTRPQPPRGYSYGKNGGVYKTMTDEDAEGKKITWHEGPKAIWTLIKYRFVD